MCIAILNKKSATLKKETLRNCWENNGDGAGILYINDDKSLGVFKEMKSFENFYDNYIDIKKNQGKKRNLVLHFRISTHGKVDETNCHPFIVSDSLGFVHNGVISASERHADYSDTYMFNKNILSKLPQGFDRDEHLLSMLADYIGSGSKLIFLNSDDQFSIVNEKAGHWANDCWFSNSSYKQVNSWVDYGGVKKSKSSLGYGSYYSGKSTYWNDTSAPSSTYNLAKEYQCCEVCELGLFEGRERENGVCDWCVADYITENLLTTVEAEEIFDITDNQMALAAAKKNDEDYEDYAQSMQTSCDMCQSTEAKRSYSWNAFLCDQCSDDLSA